VESDDALLGELGPSIPSAASADFGTPFLDVFHRYDGDFYKIDPLLFSPARIVLINLKSGRQFVFGELRPDVIRQSFAGPFDERGGTA
jgi:methenyltetrahydromethanopterin cyclohydrolase